MCAPLRAPAQRGGGRTCCGPRLLHGGAPLGTAMRPPCWQRRRGTAGFLRPGAKPQIRDASAGALSLPLTCLGLCVLPAKRGTLPNALSPPPCRHKARKAEQSRRIQRLSFAWDRWRACVEAQESTRSASATLHPHSRREPSHVQHGAQVPPLSPSQGPWVMAPHASRGAEWPDVSLTLGPTTKQYGVDGGVDTDWLVRRCCPAAVRRHLRLRACRL